MKTTIFLFIALMTSGSAMIPYQEVKRNDVMHDKKLILLEKLETGKTITTEDVWSSFGNYSENEQITEMCCPVMFSHEDMEIMKESVRHELESIKHDIRGLKNSDEFQKAMDEIRKGSEEIRRELEKMREEIRKSDRRSVEWENG
jgi:uncharacterized coiled-coil DUF342 family protein